MNRESFFKILHVVSDGPPVDKWTDKAYKEAERNNPDTHFTSSFYASYYPGDRPACSCEVYKLLNLPREPMEPSGVGITEAGKCVEEQIVERWYKMGILLGPAPPKQLYIEFEDMWVTGYMDAPLDLRPDWPYVLPVEIKTKKNKVIEEMKFGITEQTPQHANQLQAYILWCRENHKRMGWDVMGLKPAIGGVIYYASREDPRNTCEFYIPYDEAANIKARESVKKLKEAFIEDRIPEHPKELGWSKPPCQYCPYKKMHKQDIKDCTVKLSESCAVKFAKEQDPRYNVDKIRERIMTRWTQQQLELF